MIYGYGRLSQTLLEYGLVDELKIAVLPVIAGAAAPLSPAGTDRTLRSRPRAPEPHGTMQLTYTPDGGTPR